MEHFLDGQFVWLRTRTAEVYLHADEDGLSVSVRANRASRNAAWRVQHLFYEDETLVLLQGAAYGRYLAVTEDPAPLGHHGVRAKQRDFDDPELMSIRWQAVRSEEEDDDIMLLHVSPPGLHFLRANGEQDRWETGVTIDGMDNLSPMMHWVVLPIPPRDTAPPLPGPRKVQGIICPVLGRNIDEGRLRTVRYVRAGPGPDGLVDESDWVAIPFSGRSTFNLRKELAVLLGLGKGAVFTMCVRAGQYARLTPLVVDLHLNRDRLYIVVFMDGSPAIQDLQHPDVDAAQEEF